MYNQPPRRKARALAISQSIEAGRKAMLVKTLMLAGLVIGAADAIWMVHGVFATR